MERKPLKESDFIRSPNTIKKFCLQVRDTKVNARISFDLCPEIQNALETKGILKKFEMNKKSKEESSNFFDSIEIGNACEKARSEANRSTDSLINKNDSKINESESYKFVDFEDSFPKTDDSHISQSETYKFEDSLTPSHANRSFEKSKSLYEFEDLEAVCNKTLSSICHKSPNSNLLSETQLFDVAEPSGFWNCTVLEDKSPNVMAAKVNCPSTILEESGSTTKSFETACVSGNSSYFTATTKSVGDHREVLDIPEDEENEDVSLIILSDSEPEDCDRELNSNININISLEENEESKIIEEAEIGIEKLEFNDTLEEIEFIMSKGTEYIKNVVEKVTFSVHNESVKSEQKEKTVLQKKLPTPTKSWKPNSKVTNQNEKENNSKIILPTPDYKLWKSAQKPTFKKPTTFSSLKKPTNFNHIRSPISEYIKKTPANPIISSAKTNPKTTKKLEFNGNESTRRNQSTFGTQILPKKAYVSSNTKKYNDERPAIVVPGGPKIQNHLQTNKMLSVVRHEGKIRMSPKTREKSIDHSSSFTNLSIASGDVSYYTLKK